MRCNETLSIEFDSSVNIDLFYKYSIILCNTCTQDFVTTFINKLSESTVENDILEYLIGLNANPNPNLSYKEVMGYIKEQSNKVQRIQSAIVLEAINWIRNGLKDG